MTRRSAAVLMMAALFVLGLLAVFGLELSDTQAKSRRDVETRVHMRAVLAAALIDSVFRTILVQLRQHSGRYATPTVSQATMDAARQQNAYMVLLDAAGRRVIASSAGFGAQARRELPNSAAVASVRAGRPYGLGDLLPYRRTLTTDLAVSLPTRYGRRILVMGVSPTALSQFFGSELRQIPGARGARNEIVDSHLDVIASTDRSLRPGYRLTGAPDAVALRRASADYAGHYYDQVPLANSSWRLVLVSPDGALYAPVSGWRMWVPWIIFAAFALVAVTALALGVLILRATEGRLFRTQREAASDRQRLERQIAQMQRLESLGQLAGGIAHDFNNLLAVILNYSRFASEEVAAAALTDKRWERVASDVSGIERAAESAAELTRQLLAFARREVTHIEVISLNDVVTRTEQLLRRTLGEHIELALTLAADLDRVLADPSQMEQVLVNLAVNARDAMLDGGTLVIETENVEVDASYASTRPDLAPGHYVRMRVSDTGVGMDPQTMEHAFEPFFTTKPEGKGTGLGLATVYGIVTQSGGRVRLYSEHGLGTTCSVMLPATDCERAGERVTADQEDGGRGEVILMVEDEDGIREVARRILSRSGYRVLAASNGPDAIELARAHEGRIDLLMTDVIMPRMLGKDVARRIRAMRPHTCVMYMSGYAQPVLGASASVPDATTLLEKPFTERQLLAKVREALAGDQERSNDPREPHRV